MSLVNVKTIFLYHHIQVSITYKRVLFEYSVLPQYISRRVCYVYISKRIELSRAPNRNARKELAMPSCAQF